MADMNLSLVIRLLDQFSAPARQLKQNVRTVANDIKAGFSDAFRQGFSPANINAAIADAETALGRAKGRLMGAFGMGLALAAPIKSLGDFEARLIAFGNTAGIYGDNLKSIETDLRELGPTVNQSAGDMLTALEYLVGKGLSPVAGMAALRAVGMSATATGADIEQMAAAGFSAMDNLKVPAEQLQLAYDAMAQSGKMGGFELKGMAQYFPGLTASARALKMEGVPAIAELGAALQIAMKGAGSESEAANNLQNFLSKLSAPETVKRFKDMGINVEAEFQKAADSGVSVFEHMLGVINDATQGDQFKMGELFGDQQVLNFLRPMIQNLEEFKAVRDASLGADGVAEADFVRVMESFDATAKSLAISMDNLTTKASPLLEMATDLAIQLRGIVDATSDLAALNPDMTKFVVTLGASLLALGIGARAVAFVGGGLRLSALNTIKSGQGVLRFMGVGKGPGAALPASVPRPAGPVVSEPAVARAPGSTPALPKAAGPAMAEAAAPLAGATRAAGLAKWAGRAAFTGNVLFALEIQNSIQSAIGQVMTKATTWPKATTDNIQALRDELDLLKSELANLDTGAPIMDGALDPLAAQRLQIERLSNQIAVMTAEANAAAGLSGPRLGAGMPAGGPRLPSAGTDPRLTAAGGNMMDVPEIRQTISAELVDKRPPSVTVHVSAPINISGVLDPRSAANQASGQLSNAISRAMTGALHDGVD